MPAKSPKLTQEQRKARKDKKHRLSSLGRGNSNLRLHMAVGLNRSKHWAAARTYQEARDASPSSSPVR